MSDTSPLGTRADDPLLKNDPLAPGREPDGTDATTGETSTSEERTEERQEAPTADGETTSIRDDSVFASTSSSGGETEEGASRSLSRGDLLAYLIENRAAIDVLFEMLAFDRADGEEQDYRHFLTAMRERHEQAVQTYREALEEELPETSQETPSLDDAPMS